MSAPVRTPASYADLEKVPPHLVAEIIDGILHTHPRPTNRHSGSQFGLAGELSNPYCKGRGGPGGWVFYIEPQIHLGLNVIVPDIAGWRRERLSGHETAAYFDIAPDWVCEILSPATERIDRTRKRAVYARHGVSFLWFLDPDKRLIEAFALSGETWTLAGTASGGDDVSLPPFEAARFSMNDLFPLDPPFIEDPSEG
jgi:Uma2 family endonuclease